jgi:signal transduction histidine kinase
MQQLRDREYELQVLKEVAIVISSNLRLPEVLQLVADKARALVSAETLLIPMLDAGRVSYTYAAASGRNADAIVGTNFPITIGMCGWVLDNQRALLYGESDRDSFKKDSPWEPGRPSVTMVPLIVNNIIIGGMSGTGKEGGLSFTERDMELMKLISSQVAIAIENARLFAEVQSLVESLESKVKERTLELQVANQELEAFAYSVSHDLRAPLRSIDGFSLALLEDYAERIDAEGKDYLQRLRANATHMGELIDAMLTLSRVSRSELNKSTLDLSELSHEIADKLLENKADSKVKFKIEPGMLVKGDPALIDALLTNLISNAIKYSSKTSEALIKIGTATKDGKPCFRVSDNGAGFDMARSEKLFQPFQRLHVAKEFEGIGVGLATVKRIVNRHGGWIEAEAEVGKGASFFFTLEQDQEGGAA